MNPNPNSNPNPNHASNQYEPSTNLKSEPNNHSKPEQMFDTSLMRVALEACDRITGAHSAAGLAKEANVSDTAVRKAFKALKQRLPERILMENGKYTDLGKNLVLQYFSRPDTVNGAQWIGYLADLLDALPKSVVAEPTVVDNAAYWQTIQNEHQSTSLTLHTVNSETLAQIHAMNDDDVLGSDDAWEAELQAIRDIEYQRQLKRELAAAEGRQAARNHVRKGAS